MSGLLLAGGGHSHALMLRRWSMQPARRPSGLITLVSRSSTALYSGMVNLLGREPDAALLQAEDVNLHWYTKSVRSRRKVGHINVQAADRSHLQQRLTELEEALYPAGEPL